MPTNSLADAKVLVIVQPVSEPLPLAAFMVKLPALGSFS